MNAKNILCSLSLTEKLASLEGHAAHERLRVVYYLKFIEFSCNSQIQYPSMD